MLLLLLTAVTDELTAVHKNNETASQIASLISLVYRMLAKAGIRDLYIEG